MNSNEESPTGGVAFISFCDSGGMLHYVAGLQREIASHTRSLLVLVGNGSSPADLRFLLSSNRLVNRLLEKYNPAYYRCLARKLLDECKPSVVHITSSSIGLPFFIKQLQRGGAKVVYTVHDPDPHEEARSVWSRLMMRIENLANERALRLCDRIHVHSALHEKRLNERYDNVFSRKIYVSQHGCGITDAIIQGNRVPQELRDFPCGSDALVLLFFGRIEPYKGLDVLFDALASGGFSRRVVMIVAGHGNIPQPSSPLNAELISINRFVDDSEIQFLFNLADVVVLPYVSATQTGVIPLAYAFARPVIATKVGALPELVDDGATGFLVQGSDPEALRRSIECFAGDNDLARRMGEKALSYLDNRFGWSEITARHLKQYESMTAGTTLG